ncbi:MAG: alpha-ketoacid dehydrogenase subunit beta [Ardenticatenaceae bacterium]|nr:alpha-ketoacid dehydrogenase subunit beta [Ardenticatenaceae bacterium]
MSRKITMAQALNEALHEEMAAEPRSVIIGEDIRTNGGLFGVTTGLGEQFGPQRVIDAPISENTLAGFGTGLAIRGYRAIVEIQIFDFAALAMDQICNRAAKLRYMTGGQLTVPLVVRGPSASRIGLAAQHSQSLEGWFIQAPGLKVVTPSNPHDAKGLLKAAIRDDDPVIFIEHRLLYGTSGEVPSEEYIVPIGKANVVREGQDITLISNGVCMPVVLRAADQLRNEGISAEVIDLRTLKPLDIDTLVTSVSKTGRAIVVNEGNFVGGVASEVISALVNSEAFYHLAAPIRRIGLKDVPVPYAEQLEVAVLPQPDEVVSMAKAQMRGE